MSDHRQTAGLVLLALLVVVAVAGAIGYRLFRRRDQRSRSASRRTRDWGMVDEDQPPKV